MKKTLEVLNEMKSLTFSGAFPKTVCKTIFNGVLTEDIMSKVNAIMYKNGFKYHFAHDSVEWKNFQDFRPGNGTIFATVQYFGNGKPVYQWGFLRT